jgi:endoglucanase
LKELEKNIVDVNAHVNDDFDWEEVKNLGLFRYAISERPGRDPAVVKLVRGKILAVADGIVQVSKRHGYGRTLGTTYGWGCNGSAARQTLLLMVADRLTRNEASNKGRTTEYRAACLDTLNYLLGRNCYGRSFITGVGAHPPMNPHDRRSGADKIAEPWPGYLIGGPWPKATDWKDDQGDARTNEIAINWNAALIYAMAAFLQD